MSSSNFCAFTGKPINEIEYPAITICSHGSMEDMIEDAVKKQFEAYVLIKKNKNITGQTFRPKRSAAINPTEDEVDELWKSYIADYYPGTKLEPQKLVQLFRPEIAPDDYIAAKSMIDPKSVCIDTKAESCEGPWKPSSLSGVNCIANLGSGQGSDQRCEEYGGQMIDFDQFNSPKVVFEDLCYLDNGVIKEGEVPIGNIGVIKKWGPSFSIEFDIERKETGKQMNVWRLLGTINGQPNKKLASFMVMKRPDFRLNFLDIDEQSILMSTSSSQPLNEKFKYRIRQFKEGNKNFVKIEKFNSKEQIEDSRIFLNTAAPEATDVRVEIDDSVDNDKKHWILSNLKISSDPKCIFEDQSIQDFWYGGILIDGNLYTQSGLKLNDVTGVETNIGDIDKPLPPKKLCFKMSKKSIAASSDYFKVDAASIVDCDKGNSTFLCWKKPNNCSSGGKCLFFRMHFLLLIHLIFSYKIVESGNRMKRQADTFEEVGNKKKNKRRKNKNKNKNNIVKPKVENEKIEEVETEQFEPSLDRVFVPSKKAIYEARKQMLRATNKVNFKYLDLKRSFPHLFEILW